MSSYTSYLLLDRVSIQAANALSSPLTYGFPAITGFLGAIHALNRKLSPGKEITLGGVLIASHDCNVQHYRPHSYADYTFNQTRNPIKKDGKTAAIVEEGKVNLTVSLIVEVIADRETHRELKDDSSIFVSEIKKKLLMQRIAGGSVLSIRAAKWFESASSDLQRGLLPAFVLMDARRDLIDITQEIKQERPEASALDALIEVATLRHIPPDLENKEADWKTESIKTGRGWLVPIPVGFQGIAPPSEAGQLANCRNPEYTSQYVESVYSLGKWVFPFRIKDLTSAFWRYDRPENNLYLTIQSISNI